MVEAPARDVLVKALSRVLDDGASPVLEQRVAKDLGRVDPLNAALEAHLLERQVAARLQQLAHDPVGLRQIPLEQQDAPAVLFSTGWSERIAKPSTT